jgi:hypothetical protein
MPPPGPRGDSLDVQITILRPSFLRRSVQVEWANRPRVQKIAEKTVVRDINRCEGRAHSRSGSRTGENDRIQDAGGMLEGLPLLVRRHAESSPVVADSDEENSDSRARS